MVKLIKKPGGLEPDFLPDVLRIGSLAAERKALDIKAYDLRGLTPVADSFVLCSASSEPQFKAIYNGVREGMKAIGVKPLHSEGTVRGGWRVLDYGDIIVHIFREQSREFYDLDGLWGDASEIDLELDG